MVTVAAHMPPLYPASVHETTVAEARKAQQLLGVRESIFLNHPAVLLDQIPVPEFNGEILNAVKQAAPDVLLVPYYDRHIDHGPATTPPPYPSHCLMKRSWARIGPG